MMHFEILVEDVSGKKALSILIPRIIGPDHTFRIHNYKGLGRVPKNLQATSDPQKRILLDVLPKALRGYGQTYAQYPKDFLAAVIIVCDLDGKCLKAFRQELLAILAACDPKPNAAFCIAIEESEAWYLGDVPAIQSAYPKAKTAVLSSYVNDSICGTWEKLADALYPGGARTLSLKGWWVIGEQKSKWAEQIAPHMNVEINTSPSFCYFREKLRAMLPAS